MWNHAIDATSYLVAFHAVRDVARGDGRLRRRQRHVIVRRRRHRHGAVPSLFWSGRLFFHGAEEVPDRLAAEVAPRKSSAKPKLLLIDVIVGRFIAFACLLLAADVCSQSVPAALLCVLSAIVAAAAVPVGRRRRPRRRSTVTYPTNEASVSETTAGFYAGG